MFIERDFKGMKILPFGDDPDYKILKNIPELASYNTSSSHKKHIINYILLMYDPLSPFVKRYQNVKKRILAVCDYTGLSRVKKEIFETVTGYEDIEILSMIDAYVRYINMRLWSLIVVNETAFYEYQSQILFAVNDEKSKDKLASLKLKTDILKALDEMSLRLDGYYSQLYAADTKLEDAVKAKGISPEIIAREGLNA